LPLVGILLRADYQSEIFLQSSSTVGERKKKKEKEKKNKRLGKKNRKAIILKNRFLVEMLLF
jgi:hypothetical protein